MRTRNDVGDAPGSRFHAATRITRLRARALVSAEGAHPSIDGRCSRRSGDQIRTSRSAGTPTSGLIGAGGVSAALAGPPTLRGLASTVRRWRRLALCAKSERRAGQRETATQDGPGGRSLLARSTHPTLPTGTLQFAVKRVSPSLESNALSLAKPSARASASGRLLRRQHRRGRLFGLADAQELVTEAPVHRSPSPRGLDRLHGLADAGAHLVGVHHRHERNFRVKAQKERLRRRRYVA